MSGALHKAAVHQFVATPGVFKARGYDKLNITDDAAVWLYAVVGAIDIVYRF